MVTHSKGFKILGVYTEMAIAINQQILKNFLYNLELMSVITKKVDGFKIS